jgi:ribosomal protein S18 acetylase RimI-like enzyme
VTLSARAATPDDLPALAALQQRWDAHWLGAPEHDEDEVRESLDRVDPLAEHSVLLLDDGRLVAAGWWWKDDESTLLVATEAAGREVAGRLVDWLTGSGAPRAEVLAIDASLRDALEGRGWWHWLSQFELLREAAGLAAPRWPDGVTVTGLGAHAAAAYRVVYVEAAWAEVPGHGDRDQAEWHRLFLAGEDPDQQVLAWEGDRLVGVALGKTFSDGTGWVAQLAVPRDRQGRGLGTALLAEAFGRRVAAGAARLGLGVSAANRDALRLYQGLGLRIDREWMVYRPGPVSGSTGPGRRPGPRKPSGSP